MALGALAVLRRLADLLSLASYVAIFGNPNYLTGIQRHQSLTLLGTILLLLSTAARYAPLWIPSTRALQRAMQALSELMKVKGIGGVGGDGVGVTFAALRYGITHGVWLCEQLLTTNRSSRVAMLGLALVPRFVGLFGMTAFRAWRSSRDSAGARPPRPPPPSPRGAGAIAALLLLPLSIIAVAVVIATTADATKPSSDHLNPRLLAEALHVLALAHESSRLDAATPTTKLWFLTLQTLAFSVNACAVIVSKQWASTIVSVAGYLELLAESRTMGFLCIRGAITCTRAAAHYHLKQNWAFLLSVMGLAMIALVPTNEGALLESAEEAHSAGTMFYLNRAYLVAWLVIAFGGGGVGALLLLACLQLAMVRSRSWEEEAQEGAV